jgi:predicted anti-sigma-YlaC factor YlaD
MPDYLDGIADGIARDAIETHLSGCANCRREFDAVSRTKGLLGSLTSVELPGDFRRNVYEEAARRTCTAHTTGFAVIFNKRAFAYVGAALILATIFVKLAFFPFKKVISIDKLFMDHLISSRNRPVSFSRNSLTFALSNAITMTDVREAANNNESPEKNDF